MEHVGVARGNLKLSVPSFHIVGPRDQTPVARFSDKSLYRLSQLADSDFSYKSLPLLWVPLRQLMANRKKCAFQNIPT